jgi:hypothetical protein
MTSERIVSAAILPSANTRGQNHHERNQIPGSLRFTGGFRV